MPAVGNTEGGKFFYYGISDGKIRRKAPNGEKDKEEGAVLREWEDKQGNKKSRWEFTHGYIDGYIKELKYVHVEQFNTDVLELLMEHPDYPGEKYLIRVPFGSLYFNDIINRLYNVDFGDMIHIEPFQIKDEQTGKEKGYAVIYQRTSPLGYAFDKKITGRFNKENPDSKQPEWPGKEDEEAFALWKVKMKKYKIAVIEKRLIPMVVENLEMKSGLKSTLPEEGKNPTQQNTPPPPPIEPEPEDDLPF